MSSATLSRQAALRVALATKSLPNVEVRALLGLLIQHLGEPLSVEKLTKLSPKAFRVMVNSLSTGVNRREITQALVMLTEPALEGDTLPTPSKAMAIPGPKLRVAITSNYGERLDGHYGSCLRALVYEVSADKYRLVDVRELEPEMKGEARAVYLLSNIDDCQILFTLSIGGPAAARVTRANIHPIKRAQPNDASEVLEELRKVIAGTPPPWLAKALANSVEMEVA